MEKCKYGLFFTISLIFGLPLLMSSCDVNKSKNAVSSISNEWLDIRSEINNMDVTGGV